MSQHYFICHAASDAALATHIAAELRRIGHSTWMAPDDIPAGTSWAAAITANIERCAALVLVGTNAAYESPHVERELGLAAHRRKPILPIVFDPPNSGAAEYYLGSVQQIPGDRRQPLASVQRHFGAPRAATAPPAAKPAASLGPAGARPGPVGATAQPPTGDHRALSDRPFLMPIEDVFTITGRGTIVVGQVRQGVIRVNEEIEILGLPPGKSVRTTVGGIEKFREVLDEARAGENVGLMLRGVKREAVSRGQAVARLGQFPPDTDPSTILP
ncbi:MAG: TIR domain-containing protein [Actinomycetales bacterium]|nr:TIR domain-containing protein [Actinomycetales bacterium]